MTTPTTQSSVDGEGRGKHNNFPRFFRIRDFHNTPVIEVAVNALLTPTGKLRWAIATWSLKDRRKAYDRKLAQHIAHERTTTFPVRVIEPGLNLRARIIKAISTDQTLCRLAREVALYNLSNHATARRIERIHKRVDKAKRKAAATKPSPADAPLPQEKPIIDPTYVRCTQTFGELQCTLRINHEGIHDIVGDYSSLPTTEEPSATKGLVHGRETTGVATPPPGNTFPARPLYPVKVIPEPSSPTLLSPEEGIKLTCPLCKSAPDRPCVNSNYKPLGGDPSFMHRARLDPEWWKSIEPAFSKPEKPAAN